MSPLSKKFGAVLHHIAHLQYLNGLVIKAFTLKVLHGGISWAKQYTANLVGKNTVNFFWHLHIKTTQACLNVRNWNMQFSRRQSTSKRGIGIAIHQHPIWL